MISVTKSGLAVNAERQRPFKIIISLLDKWEIGFPLTEAIVLDAFGAIQVGLESEGADEVLLDLHPNRICPLTCCPSQIRAAGMMLFDALQPFLTWKRVFTAVQEEMAGDVDNDNVKFCFCVSSSNTVSHVIFRV
jgi:hypothetical protein